MILIIYYVVSPITFLLYVMYYNHIRKNYIRLAKDKTINNFDNYSIKYSNKFMFFSFFIVMLNFILIGLISNKYYVDNIIIYICAVSYIPLFCITIIYGLEDRRKYIELYKEYHNRPCSNSNLDVLIYYKQIVAFYFDVAVYVIYLTGNYLFNLIF